MNYLNEENKKLFYFFGNFLVADHLSVHEFRTGALFSQHDTVTNRTRPGRSVHQSGSVRLKRFFGFSDQSIEVPFGFLTFPVRFRFGTNRVRIGSGETMKIRLNPKINRIRFGFGL